MKLSFRLTSVAASFAVASVLVFVVGASSAAPTPTVPSGAKTAVTGPQDKPSIAPGSLDAKQTTSLGQTNKLSVDAEKSSEKSRVSATANLGYVSTVDFATPLNYCYHSLTYLPLKNTTATTRYAHLYFYAGGMTREYYVSIPANSTVYPAFYGTEGSWSSSLYTWNGSSYVSDEYVSGSNTCNVSVTRSYNTAGWVQLKIQNLGTAYASQQSSELAPFPNNATYSPYTGTFYDYPVAGGAAIYRWFYVGTSPYGIVSTTLNSYLSPVTFTGDL